MKAIVYNIFGLGHINPTLPLIRELSSRGVKIIYHTTPLHRALIEETGAEFRNYGRDNYSASDYNPGKNFILQTLPATVGLLPFLKEEIEREKPDFLIYDSMAPWGLVLSRLFSIPSYCMVTTFALSVEVRQKTFAGFGIEPDEINIRAMESLNLKLIHAFGAYNESNFVFTSSGFNPPLGDMNPAHFHFVGLSTKSENLRRERKKPLVVMALGTILPEEDPSVLEWYRIVAEALEDQDVDLVLGVGNSKNVEALSQFSSVDIRAHIPQKELLAEASVLISHAGMNSVNEALSMGVPTLLIPHSKDQFINAARVKELEIGLCLQKGNLTPSLIRESIFDLCL